MQMQASYVVPWPKEERLAGVVKFTELHRVIDDGWPPLSNKYNTRFQHDPKWSERFWSIQCIHDSIMSTAEHPGHVFGVLLK